MNETEPLLAEFASEVGATGPVAVEGSRSHWHIGGSVDPATRLLRAPEGIVEFQPEEMTVTVRAGTSVSVLHDHLAESSQRTALGGTGAATVGGVLAVGASSVDRLGRGHVRDSVLRIRYVSADGQVVCAGGGTVKNVSGFDLCRLMVGSIGTLGLFAEVTLRTIPVAAVESWWSAPDVATGAVLDSASIAHSILWDGTTTWVHLCGIGVDVEATLSNLEALGSWSETTPPALPPYRHSVRPSDIGPVDDGPFIAEVGVGTVHAHSPAEPKTPARAVVELNRAMKLRFDPQGRLNPGRDVLEATP